MDEPKWDRPNHFFAVIRCMEQEFGYPFFEKGQIKFSTPNSWVEAAKRKGTGRGDLLEGTLATFNVWDDDNAVPLLKKYYSAYTDIEPFLVKNRCYLKRGSDMELPCLCMYYLKNSMFQCPNEPGLQEIQCDIPASYFRDFADNLTQEEVEALPEERRPCIVVINDYPEFKRRLIDKLMSIGVKREEILEVEVSYLDFEKYGETGWWDFGQKSPLELAVKHTRFAAQNEGRFIINTTNSKVKEILKKPIEIGSISDISQFSNQYFHDGIHVVAHAYIEEVT